MLEKIKELLPDYCEGLDNITEETTLAGDLGISSMDYFMFVNSIEDEFGIKITDNEIHNILTIGDVIKCIEGKKNA